MERCQYGTMTSEEYRTSAPNRPICTAKATEYVTRPGTSRPDWYCTDHAGR